MSKNKTILTDDEVRYLYSKLTCDKMPKDIYEKIMEGEPFTLEDEKRIKEIIADEISGKNKRLLRKAFVTPKKFAKCIDSIFSNSYVSIAILSNVDPKRENISVDMFLDWLSKKGDDYADLITFFDSFYEEITDENIKYSAKEENNI